MSIALAALAGIIIGSALTFLFVRFANQDEPTSREWFKMLESKRRRT